MTVDELAALSERAARVLTSGGGLKALAQLLADAFGGAVLVEDDQWRHLALAQAAGSSGALPPSFAPHYAQPAPEDNGVARATPAPNLHALCAPMPGASSEADGVAGYVTLFVRGKTAPKAAAALRVIASAAGVESIRRGAGRTHARRAFWERFLSGGFAEAETLRSEAATAGVSLPPAYLAAVFDVEGSAPTAIRDTMMQALAPADAQCPLAPAGGQLLALFPVRHLADVARARQAATNAVRDLVEQAAARAITCGIGGHHADILDAPKSGKEARQALALGRRLFGRNSVTLHADLGIYALLHAGAERESFARFAETCIEPLASYDRKHKTDLLATLRLYFDVGENVKEAAERLSVHRHTIFYRLNQISQILKVDLRSPKDQLFLRAALAIRQMHHEDER